MSAPAIAPAGQQPYAVAPQQQFVAPGMPQERHGLANLLQGAVGALAFLFGGPLGWIFGGALMVDAASDYFTGRGAWGQLKHLTGWEPNNQSRGLFSTGAEWIKRPSPAGYSMRPQQAPLS